MVVPQGAPARTTNVTKGDRARYTVNSWDLDPVDDLELNDQSTFLRRQVSEPVPKTITRLPVEKDHRSSGLLARRASGRFGSNRPTLKIAVTRHGGTAASTVTSTPGGNSANSAVWSTIGSLDSIKASSPSSWCSRSCSAEEPKSPGGTRLSEVYEETDEVLGRGSFCMVFTGREKTGGELVALKTTFSDDHELHEISRREWAILETVKHPNIVKGHGIFSAADKLVLVMQRCPGLPLQEAVTPERGGCFIEEEAKIFFRYLIEAVAYLHSKLIVHRDIKATNIIVDREPSSLQLIDLNSARQLSADEEDPLTPFGGTTLWAAPEVLKRQITTVSPTATDIWAVGLCLHVMLVGRLPNEHLRVSTREELAQSLQNIQFEFETPPLLQVTPACKALLKRCLEADVYLRPAASQLLVDVWMREQAKQVAFERCEVAAGYPSR